MPATPEPTARLVFRWWRDDDVALAELLWGDLEVTRFIGGPLDPRAMLAAHLDHARVSQCQYWPVFEVGGDLVGCCGLKPKQPGVLELGFHLRPTYWGGGYAAEAARAAIAHGFGVLGASWLFAGHHPANAGSAKLLGKLGFVRTGEELYPPTGLLHPSYRLTPPRTPP